MEQSLAELVSTWMADAGLSAAVVARRSGLSSSTIHRVVNGRVDPSFGTVREIGLACGVDPSVCHRPLSDWAAAAAARVVLEEGYVPAESDAVTGWVERLHRTAGGDDPIDLVVAGATASAPLLRQGAHLYRGEVTVGRVASAGHASAGRWALSGAVGLHAGEVSPGSALPATSILWCDDPERASQLLADDESLKPTRNPLGATLAIVRADDGLYHDSFVEGIVTYVAPIQIVMDCISIGGPVAALALEEARSW